MLAEDLAKLPLLAPVRGEARALPTRSKPNARPDGTLSREEFALVWDAYASQFPPGVVVQNTPPSVLAAGGFGHDEVWRYLRREPLTFVPVAV